MPYYYNAILEGMDEPCTTWTAPFGTEWYEVDDILEVEDIVEESSEDLGSEFDTTIEDDSENSALDLDDDELVARAEARALL